MKTFWKWLIILDAAKNIIDSWEEVEMSTFKGVWKLILTLMDDFEGFKT